MNSYLVHSSGSNSAADDVPAPPPPYPGAHNNPQYAQYAQQAQQAQQAQYAQQAPYYTYGGMSQFQGPQCKDSLKVFEFRGFVGDISLDRMRPEQVAGTLAFLDQVRNGTNSYDPSHFKHAEKEPEDKGKGKDDEKHHFRIPRPYVAADSPPPPPPPPKEDDKKCDKCKKEPDATGLKKFEFENEDEKVKWCWPCVWYTYGEAASEAWRKAAAA